MIYNKKNPQTTKLYEERTQPFNIKPKTLKPMLDQNLGLAKVKNYCISILTVFYLPCSTSQPMELYIKKTAICFGNKIERRY